MIGRTPPLQFKHQNTSEQNQNQNQIPISLQSIQNSLPNSPTSSSNHNRSPEFFPESDEIKSKENLQISSFSPKTDPLKFRKLPSRGNAALKKTPFKTSTSISLMKQLSGSLNSFKTMREIKETQQRLLKEQDSLLMKKEKSVGFGMTGSFHESMESLVDENTFIRKLKRPQKSKEDARFIYNYMKHLTFFNKFREQSLKNSVEEAILHICRNCEYEKHERNCIIFKEGDRSNEKFYIVISGTVHIYLKERSVFVQENMEKPLNNTNTNTNANANNNSNNSNNNTGDYKAANNTLPLRRKSSLFASPKLVSEKALKKKGSMMVPSLGHHFQKHAIEREPITPKPRIVDQNQTHELGALANELGPGEAFGEKALIALEPDAKRTATTVAATDVELMIIRKTEFDKILQRFSVQNERKMKFLTEVMPFLKSIHSVSTLENLVYSFKEESIGLNMTVTEEGEYDASEKIYVLFEGICRVQRKVNFLMNGMQHCLDCSLCDLVKGSLIGEEIIFKELARKDAESQAKFTYNYTVIVLSEKALFYVISKSNFLMKFPKEIRNFLWEQFKIKEKSRKELFSKNSQELIKNYQEEQFQVLIQANFLKNQDLLKRMNLNLKRNYIEKVKGLAEELTKEGNSYRKIKKNTDNSCETSGNNENLEEEQPFSIIESLKNQAKFKEMTRHRAEIAQEIINDPYEIEEFLRKNEHKFILRSDFPLKTLEKAKIKAVAPRKNSTNMSNFPKKKQNLIEKLDFGNGQEDEKLEKMRRIQLGLLKPETLTFSHYDILDHYRNKKQKKTLISLRKNSLFDLSSVKILKIYEKNDQFPEKTAGGSRTERERNEREIRKGRTLVGFHNNNATAAEKAENLEVLCGDSQKTQRKKKKDFKFYESLREKGENYQRLFSRNRKFRGNSVYDP